MAGYLTVARTLMMFVGLSALSVTNPSIAGGVNKDLCDDEWNGMQDLSPADRVRHWASVGPKCGNSGLYEVRLARLNTIVGRYEDARRVVETGLALHSPYEKELLSAGAEADTGLRKLDSALRTYMQLITDYPDYYDGYGGVGSVKLLQHQFTEAVKYLNEAAKRGKPLYIFRNLVIAYHQLGENQQAIDAMSAGYKVDKAITKDVEAMNAAARSYVFMGKYHQADGTLKMLIQANPQAANDPGIREAQLFVVKKLAEEKQSGTAGPS